MQMMRRLIETVSNNPIVNKDIEERLAYLNPAHLHVWIDLLQVIHDAGQPVSVREVFQQMTALYRNDPSITSSTQLGTMFMLLPVLFDNVIDDVGGNLSWKGNPPMTGKLARHQR